MKLLKLELRKEPLMLALLLLAISFIITLATQGMGGYSDFIYQWERIVGYSIISIVLLPFSLLEFTTRLGTSSALPPIAYILAEALLMGYLPLVVAFFKLKLSRKDTLSIMIAFFIVFLIPKLIEVALGLAPITKYAPSYHPELHHSSLVDWTGSLLLLIIVYGIFTFLFFTIVDYLEKRGRTARPG